MSEAAERLEDLLEEILEQFDMEGTVEVSEDEERLLGSIDTDDAGPLIGHHGQTIDAIQHLAYRIAFRGERVRKGLTVDAGGYRERRARALRAAGEQAAERAVRDGRPVALDPMTAIERKVVHEHLKARHDVETYSEGEEPNRHLVVAPVA